MWNKIKYSLQRFMLGRYGVDKFGLHILWFIIAMNLISIFTGKYAVYLRGFTDLLFIYEMYRTLSKNFVKRSIENTKYLDFLTRVKRRWKVTKNNVHDKQYHYYLCPKCAQIVRVPRGRGKIEIHCPNCRHTFEKRS